MRKELPDYIQRALRTGERTWHTGGYSRNHLVFSVALSACQNGWTCKEFTREILDPKNLAGEKFQAMPERKARKMLERDWERATDFVEANPPMKGRDAVRKRLGNTVSVVLGLPWGGRTGNTDRHILLTILALAYDVGTYTPAFSTRTLAMVANKRQETVSNALARLREAGHLGIVTPSTYTKSPVYEITSLRLQTGSLNTYPGRESSDPLKSVRDVLGHDIFSAGCLGQTAGRLWTELHQSRSYSAREMARATGLGETACRRAARRLAEVGLMVVAEGRPARFQVEAPYGRDPAYLDQIQSVHPDLWEEDSPDLTGYVGRADRRAKRFERERQVRKDAFAHHDRATGEVVDPFTGEVIERSAA